MVLISASKVIFPTKSSSSTTILIYEKFAGLKLYIVKGIVLQK